MPSVYNSLVKQSNKDFVWLVIDDGSTDGTKKSIDKFKKEKKIEIHYYYKTNGGKASALNYALDIIKTDYFCCLDSDDCFEGNAVERVISLLDEEKDNDDCCGIVALRHDSKGMVLGGIEIPLSHRYVTTAELYSIVKKTELICFYKRSTVEDIRFPIVKGEKFISPTWFQYKATEKRKFRTSRDRLCVCEYQADGLTKNKKKIIVQNPIGYTLVKKESLRNSHGFYNSIKHATMYDCGCIISQDKKWLLESPKKFLCAICYPLGFLVYLKSYRSIRKTKGKTVL